MSLAKKDGCVLAGARMPLSLDCCTRVPSLACDCDAGHVLPPFTLTLSYDKRLIHDKLKRTVILLSRYCSREIAADRVRRSASSAGKLGKREPRESEEAIDAVAEAKDAGLRQSTLTSTSANGSTDPPQLIIECVSKSLPNSG